MTEHVFVYMGLAINAFVSLMIMLKLWGFFDEE